MPRHLISDAHEWINEIPTVPDSIFPLFFSLLFLSPKGATSSSQLQDCGPPLQRRSEPFSNRHVAMATVAVPLSSPPINPPPPSCVSIHPSSIQPPPSSANPRSSPPLPSPPAPAPDPSPPPPSAAVLDSDPDPVPLRGAPISSAPHPRSHPAPAAATRRAAPPPLSYAQATRAVRGTGFVNSHAVAVEHFARVPRTGANIICGSRDGVPSFSFISADLPKVEEIYSNALVMKFAGGRPSLEASHKEIQSWGMENSFSIGPLSSRAFLLRFLDVKDLLKVLTRPSSLLISFPYKIFRWHNLCHLTEDSALAPVWISLPRLPLQCFIPEFLESVGNKIGRFLCFDRATTTLARPSAARICVELDLRKSPPQSIWVGLYEGFKQAIIYERLPKYCNNCHLIGHSTAECSKLCSEVLPSAAGTPTSLHKERTATVRRNAEQLIGPKSQSATVPLMPSTTSVRIPAGEEHSNAIRTQLPPSQQSTTVPTIAPSHLPTASLSSPQLENLAACQPPLHDGMSYPNSNVQPPVMQQNITHGDQPPNSVEVPPFPPDKSLPRKGKHKKKKVSFKLPGQSNLSANRDFWNAVNRQVAIIDQVSTIIPGNSSDSSHPTALNIPELNSNPIDTAVIPLDQNGDDSPASSIAAESPPLSPRARTHDPRPSSPTHDSVSYASDGDDVPTELSPMLGHNTDEVLHKMPHSSKRNKRHPDQPLNVHLRVRKDPASTLL